MTLLALTVLLTHGTRIGWNGQRPSWYASVWHGRYTSRQSACCIRPATQNCPLEPKQSSSSRVPEKWNEILREKWASENLHGTREFPVWRATGDKCMLIDLAKPLVSKVLSISRKAHPIIDNRLNCVLDVFLEVLDAHGVVEDFIHGHEIFALHHEPVLCDTDEFGLVPAISKQNQFCKWCCPIANGGGTCLRLFHCALGMRVCITCHWCSSAASGSRMGPYRASLYTTKMLELGWYALTCMQKIPCSGKHHQDDVNMECMHSKKPKTSISVHRHRLACQELDHFCFCDQRRSRTRPMHLWHWPLSTHTCVHICAWYIWS